MRFSRPRDKAPTLGTLEIAILRAVWSTDGPVDARQLLARLAERRITLSTVQATLERLHRKALLARTKVGRAYHYSAAVSQSRLIGSLIRELTQEIAAGELEPVIAGFVELVGDSDPGLLDRLQHEAAEQRRKERQ
jgi:predicted transcriptional regulator